MSLTVPLVIRLSPLHPGYVMTRCAEDREAKMERKRAASNEHLSGVLDDIVLCLCSALTLVVYSL